MKGKVQKKTEKRIELLGHEIVIYCFSLVTVKLLFRCNELHQSNTKDTQNQQQNTEHCTVL